MLVSFIIPSYNSKHTVKRCLDSIYALSLQQEEFEVVFIDDCSTDDTCDVVSSYQAQHSNLTLLRQLKNNRQGAARNRGVGVSKGEYICFVDSDDAVAEGIVDAIYLAKEKRTDMTVFNYCHADEQGKILSEKEHLSFGQGQLFSGVELQTKHPYWCSGPVAYVYDKDFLKRVHYPYAEGVLFEDSDFVNVHLFFAKRMSYCDKCGYVVHYNADSTTRTLSYKHLCDYALLGTRMLKFYNSIEDKASIFADGILEGGSYNIMKAFRNLPKLKSFSEVCAFYDRLDSHFDRKLLLEYRRPAYCWTEWTRFCLKHRKLAIIIVGAAIPFVRLVIKN